MINLVKIVRRATCSVLRILAPAVLASLFAVVLSCCEIINDELPSYEATSIVRVGDLAPEFVAQTIDDEIVKVGGKSDEPLLLILFSHTCPDCKNLLVTLQQTIDSGVDYPAIVAVSRGGSSQEIEQYRDENHFTFTIVADSDKKIYYNYAEMYVPRCYVIDREGYVTFMTYEYTPGDVELLFSQASILY